jgi:hypothetical protein
MLASALSLVLRYRSSGGRSAADQVDSLRRLVGVPYVPDRHGRFVHPPIGGLDYRGFGVVVEAPDVCSTAELHGGPDRRGLAVLKYRLYDLDVLINRTLVYGSLTATLALVYLGGVVGLQAAFRALSGQESTLAVVASTVAIAALSSPLRRRMQALVDRRFYRRKYDAARTLAAFNSRLREETDLNTLTDDVMSVVRETMQPAHVSLWLRPDTAPKGERAD